MGRPKVKMKIESLSFDKLFKQALIEWPKFLNLELESEEFEEVISTDKGYDLVRYKRSSWNKKFDAYVVKGLYELCEDISKKYYGHPQELLMVNLHDNIFKIVRNLAKYLTYLELNHLRPEMVQQNFEEILAGGVKNKREDWRKEEIQIINNYFSVNPSEVARQNDGYVKKSPESY